MSIMRPILTFMFILVVLTACEVDIQHDSPGPLPQQVQDAWADVFQERAITAYDISFDGTDTTYTLYSGYKNEDATSLDFYVKTEGDEDHDSYQMVVSESGEVLNIREETVLAESEFPPELLSIVRAEYPDQKLVGMRRILEYESVSYAVSVVLRDSKDWIEIEKFRFSLDGKVLEKSHISRNKHAAEGSRSSN